jgi:hypothetical protein
MSIESVTVDGVEYPMAPLEMPVSNKPESEWMAITPRVAEAWLRANKSNRHLRVRQAAAQARDMVSGNWHINGETVKLSRPLRKYEVEDLPEGYVLFLDGQHRFEACIDSGQPFVTLVVWGLAPESRNTMDSGVSRAMHDVLKMNGESNTTTVSSVLRRVYLWKRGDQRAKEKTTHSELLEFLSENRDAILRAAEKAVYVRAGFPHMAQSVLGTAYFLCYEISPQEALDFFERLRDGAGLEAGSPILTLRNRIVRDQRNQVKNGVDRQLALTIKAWNFYRAGSVIEKLQIGTDEAMPTPK